MTKFDFQNSPTVKAISHAARAIDEDGLKILALIEKFATPEERAAVTNLQELILLYADSFKRSLKFTTDQTTEDTGLEPPPVVLSDFNEVISALDAAEAAPKEEGEGYCAEDAQAAVTLH